MEFETRIDGQLYKISVWNKKEYLVSGEDGDYILYKNGVWKCAETLPPDLIEELGSQIDEKFKTLK
jgi:hypothetical protein